MNITPKEEIIPLTPHALQVLLALANRPLHGYGLSHQTRKDSEEKVCVGRGTLHATLKRLESMGLIARASGYSSGQGKPAPWYKLTTSGKMVLEWEIERLRIIVHLGYERLNKPKKELASSFFKGF